MRVILLLALFSMFAFAQSDEKESFLSAWESNQSNNDSVEAFKKISDGKYYIKFKSLPYEGELILLTYEIEDMPYVPEESSFTKSGYVEVDIPEAMDDLVQKYSRTYHKWAQNNTLYFDSKAESWVTAEKFTASFRDDFDSSEGDLLVTIYEYWGYALIGIILYFLWSTIINNKRTKNAIARQEEVLEKSFKLSEESIAIQKKSIEESIELHKNTNKLLSDILMLIEKKKI